MRYQFFYITLQQCHDQESVVIQMQLHLTMYQTIGLTDYYQIIRAMDYRTIELTDKD